MNAIKAIGLVSTWMKFVIKVTPEMAAAWLAKGNPKNRKINDARVNAYARDMKKGKWCASPLSAIGFDRSGMLLNGHHRLHAVVKSGVTIDLVVFDNVPNEVLRFTDTELPRTNAQIGKMFDEDVSLDAALKVVVFCRTNGHLDYLSASDLEELREEFSDVAANYGEEILSIKVGGRKLRAGAVAGFLMILKGPVEKGIDPAVAAEFLRDFSATSRREHIGSKASLNLVRWLENMSGVHARLAYEGAAIVAGALRQFASKQDKDYVKVTSDALVPYLPAKSK